MESGLGDTRMTTLTQAPLRRAGMRRGLLIRIEGQVQGVGFRPFVNRLALSHGITGWVLNRAGRVEVGACGDATALERFLHDLVAKAPPLARPWIAKVRPADVEDRGSFTIRPSRSGGGSGTELPPDYSVCDDCLAEMADPAARRYRYPFINCTQCGPRYSIIRALPYDRANTTMAEFVMCPECRAQYSDPADRRYHAQPLACPVCGPQLRFHGIAADVCGNDAALAACVQALKDGLTVAIKGIGGYHLVCDATREASVARLRAAKRRPAKPFAVMVPTAQNDPLAWARRLAELNEIEASLLCDPMRPIVLVRRRMQAGLTPAVAPGLVDIGLMLPYSPLHHLLLQAFAKPIVATSANISGEPVLTDGAEVEARLAACCDAYLHHDRQIHRPADDPVIRVIAGRAVPIRLGRGTASSALPVPVALNAPVLACGDQMRTTVALGWGNGAVVSPHIGDLGSPRTAKVFESVADGFEQLYGIQSEQTLCDAHPGFPTRTWARRRRRPIGFVHHHHAHTSALLGEHRVASPTLVFTWDGVGLGEDGGLWGGEALYGSPGCWRRLGSFRPLTVVGGDAVAYEPWRSAAAVCWALGIAWGSHRPGSALVRHAWEKRVNAHETSAVGRLFDAAAALLGLIDVVSYDGQAPAMLEAVARAPARQRVPMPLRNERSSIWTVDWEPLMRALMAPAGAASASVTERVDLFHSSLAGSVLDQARAARRVAPVTQVGLTGGVFQNRRLTEEAAALLRADGFGVLLHERVPPNDGGLSYGQVVEVAGRQAHRVSPSETARTNGA